MDLHFESDRDWKRGIYIPGAHLLVFAKASAQVHGQFFLKGVWWFGFFLLLLLGEVFQFPLKLHVHYVLDSNLLNLQIFSPIQKAAFVL